MITNSWYFKFFYFQSQQFLNSEELYYTFIVYIECISAPYSLES